MNRCLQWESTGVLNWKDLEVSNEKGVFSENVERVSNIKCVNPIRGYGAREVSLNRRKKMDSKSSLKTDRGSLMKISKGHQ